MRPMFLLAVVACCGSPNRLTTVPAPAPIVVAPVPTPPPRPAPVVVPEPMPIPPPEQIWLAECRDSLAKAKQQYELLVAATRPHTIENTLDVYNELGRNVGNAAAFANLTSEVHPDAKVREAARSCEQEATAFTSQLLLDKRAFDAINNVDLSKADASTRWFVATTLRDYRRAGVDLDSAKRTRMRAIDDEMTQLGQQFTKNVAEDGRFIEVTDATRLGGLPADWVAAHKPDVHGVIKITTDYPDYGPFMSYASDDELRKQLYIKFQSRGDAHNEAVLQNLLVLRLEKAKLLGFATWADYQSDDKMLRGGTKAATFIERITALAQARAKRDIAELSAALRTNLPRMTHVDPKAVGVNGWQKAWLEREVKKDKYAVDSNVVREYFVYERVLAGLLEITSTIYDIQYRPAQDSRTWHPDVAIYDVMRGTEKLGRIFLDMHPRADKYKHAAQFGIKDGVVGKQLPEGALVCNFPDPRTSDGPALMEHDQVVTMFHEFGHLMHHILGGKQRWARQSGVATEQDFVEAPSQMFEEWGRSYETLSRFAKHYKTGEPIPKDLVAKMRHAEKFGLGTQVLQQMFYAAISLEFHRADPAKLDQLATVKRLQARYTPFPFVDGTRFHTSFGHLIGYSSMYYTYMWSLVIAKDLQTVFVKPGLLATEATYKYRDAILAAGGTKPAADLVKDFLGRAYDFKAYEAFLASD